jgi:hypothetical protein
LPRVFIDALLKMHAILDADLIGALETGIAVGPRSLFELGLEKTSKPPTLPDGKYAAEFLGMPFAVQTLPNVFAAIVDITAEVAPEALDMLATLRSRKRRFVARNPEEIHPGNRSLPVRKTASGWWISKNIGQEDLKRALRALCDTAGLTFGKDVKFPLNRSAR